MLIEVMARRRSLPRRTNEQRALDRRREYYQIAGYEGSFWEGGVR